MTAAPRELIASARRRAAVLSDPTTAATVPRIEALEKSDARAQGFDAGRLASAEELCASLHARLNAQKMAMDKLRTHLHLDKDGQPE